MGAGSLPFSLPLMIDQALLWHGHVVLCRVLPLELSHPSAFVNMVVLSELGLVMYLLSVSDELWC